jgi:hypothetical protein
LLRQVMLSQVGVRIEPGTTPLCHREDCEREAVKK